ncbi:MAG: hypothetical protein MPW13_10850 [Candidatus Manganitrophus sp.]|nr:hypothetical protein [Candidatus Manganitrophus sp.]
MKPTLFRKAGIRSLFILTLLLFQAPLFGADRPAPSDKTIVLDESRIKGVGSVAKGAGGTGSNEPLPALSTPFLGRENKEKSRISPRRSSGN